MDTNVTSEQLMNGPHNPEVHHERSDVSVSGVFLFGLVLIVSAVIIHFIVWGMMHYFTKREAQSGRPLPTFVVRPPRAQTIPEPRLQVSPQEDLQSMRAEEDAILDHYDWVDQQTQIVRIPVERAMQLLTERGLPVQQEASGDTAKPPAGQR
jgi:hypothetical protein